MFIYYQKESQDRTKNIINSLKYVRDNTDYPVEYILEYIATEYKNYISMEMLEAEYSETKIYRAPVSKYSLDEIIQFCRENPEIYIYGNGSYAAKLYLLLQAHLKNFKGFIVSDGQNTNAAVIGGKKVFQWSEIESKTAGILIGLNKDNADEIRETVSGDRVLYLW